MNQFKLIDNWSELPKEFRRIIRNPNVFKLYSERGNFLFIKGPEDNYLAHISPKEITIVNSNDKSLTEFDLGNQLNLNILNLTLKDVVDYLKNRSKNKLSQIKNEGIYRKPKGMKKTLRLSENDLVKLIKKVLNEEVAGGDPIIEYKECFVKNSVDTNKLSEACKSQIRTGATKIVLNGTRPPMGEFRACWYEKNSQGEPILQNIGKSIYCMFSKIENKIPLDVVRLRDWVSDKNALKSGDNWKFIEDSTGNYLILSDGLKKVKIKL